MVRYQAKLAPRIVDWLWIAIAFGCGDWKIGL